MDFNDLKEESARNASTSQSIDESPKIFENDSKEVTQHAPLHPRQRHITKDSLCHLESSTEVPFNPCGTEDSCGWKSDESQSQKSSSHHEKEQDFYASERRLIESERTKTTANAKADLEDVLNRIHDVTNTLLQEMSGFLETMSEVELDYIKVLKSQESEKIRLENVVPDITDTTSTLL